MWRVYIYLRAWAMDPDSGSSVTLIYYRIGEKWWREPFLNVVAAAAQMSSSVVMAATEPCGGKKDGPDWQPS